MLSINLRRRETKIEGNHKKQIVLIMGIQMPLMPLGSRRIIKEMKKMMLKILRM